MASARPETKPKPLKRPTQARAKATVQAIFDAFVRIWQRDGWARLTTRAVALEAGIAVGTLYDYFPSKTALQSGYVRHCIEHLIRAVGTDANGNRRQFSSQRVLFPGPGSNCVTRKKAVLR